MLTGAMKVTFVILRILGSLQDEFLDGLSATYLQALSPQKCFPILQSLSAKKGSTFNKEPICVRLKIG